MDNLVIIITILLALIIIVSSIFKVYRNNMKNNVLTKVIKTLKEVGSITTLNKKYYLKTKNNQYEIVLYYLANNKSLTINSKGIWEEHSKVNTLIDQRKHTNDKIDKIFIVYPSTAKVKIYINENELKFVNFSKVYNFYVIPYTKISQLVKVL